MSREAFPFRLSLKLGVLCAELSPLPSSSGAFHNITEIPELMMGVCTQPLLGGSDPPWMSEAHLDQHWNGTGAAQASAAPLALCSPFRLLP